MGSTVWNCGSRDSLSTAMRSWLMSASCPTTKAGLLGLRAGMPGVVREGDTEEEAWKNIVEALTGTLHSYLESGDDIPWQKTAAEVPPHAKCRRIAVHVPIADDQRSLKPSACFRRRVLSWPASPAAITFSRTPAIRSGCQCQCTAIGRWQKARLPQA